MTSKWEQRKLGQIKNQGIPKQNRTYMQQSSVCKTKSESSNVATNNKLILNKKAGHGKRKIQLNLYEWKI